MCRLSDVVVAYNLVVPEIQAENPKGTNIQANNLKAEVEPDSNSLDGVIILQDLIDSIPSKVDDAALHQLCENMKSRSRTPSF